MCLPSLRSKEICPKYLFKAPLLCLSVFLPSVFLNRGYVIREGGFREDGNIKTVFLA